MRGCGRSSIDDAAALLPLRAMLTNETPWRAAELPGAGRGAILEE